MLKEAITSETMNPKNSLTEWLLSHNPSISRIEINAYRRPLYQIVNSLEFHWFVPENLKIDYVNVITELPKVMTIGQIHELFNPDRKNSKGISRVLSLLYCKKHKILIPPNNFNDAEMNLRNESRPSKNMTLGEFMNQMGQINS